MVFDLKEKVALVTGGSSGMGLEIAKTLLRNGAKGVALADVDSVLGKKAVDDIEKEFGKNRAIFVETDVTDRAQFENAFKETVANFQNIDILFNNAGIFNDVSYEKEIAINVTGTVHGILLGLENYLQKYRQGEESVIVNTSSVAGIAAYDAIPVYSATKAAIMSMTRSWGAPEHYDRTKVRCVAICPGGTRTQFLANFKHMTFGVHYAKLLQGDIALQMPEHVAQETMKVVRSAKTGTLWVIEGGEPPYEYILPGRETMKEHTIKESNTKDLNIKVINFLPSKWRFTYG